MAGVRRKRPGFAGGLILLRDHELDIETLDVGETSAVERLV